MLFNTILVYKIVFHCRPRMLFNFFFFNVSLMMSHQCKYLYWLLRFKCLNEAGAIFFYRDLKFPLLWLVMFNYIYTCNMVPVSKIYFIKTILYSQQSNLLSIHYHICHNTCKEYFDSQSYGSLLSISTFVSNVISNDFSNITILSKYLQIISRRYVSESQQIKLFWFVHSWMFTEQKIGKIIILRLRK